jgi:addiction module HigA family antidote
VCDGDVRAALKALIVANDYLDSEPCELMQIVSRAEDSRLTQIEAMENEMEDEENLDRSNLHYIWLDRRRCHRRRSGGLSLKDRMMTRKPVKRGLPPMHPGELLREEILPALDRPKTEIAKLPGVSRQTLYDVLKEKQPVTPGMALRLGKLCGNGPDLWLNLQRRYDLRQAEQELGEKIKDIPTLEVA